MPRNVLLIEDNTPLRESLTRLLREMGYAVCAVWSAEDAKTALATFTPDVALVELRLPGLPGDAFALYLRHKVPHVKIVFMSGEFKLGQPERFGEAVDFIPKPYDLNRIITAMR